MTTNPKTLSALSAYWQSKHGVPLGIVGNAAHKSGYHLGKDRIFGTGGQGWGDYSVRQTRDKAGLTNAASAIDLGRLNQSLGSLYAFSRWLVRQCQAGATGSRDVREIIYSPDGTKVQRWSGVDNAIYTGPGNGDSSHLTHTHISYFRDSETRDKVALFAPYFATSAGDDMPTLTSYAPGHIATVKATSNIRSTPAITGNTPLRSVPAGKTETWAITGTVKGEVDAESGSDSWYVRWAAGRWEYTAKVNVIALATPGADCGAAIDAALAPVQYELALARVELTQAQADTQAAIAASVEAARIEQERIALAVGVAEADRIRNI